MLNLSFIHLVSFQPYYMCNSKSLSACISKMLLSLIPRGRNRRLVTMLGTVPCSWPLLDSITLSCQHRLIILGKKVQVKTEVTVNSLGVWSPSMPREWNWNSESQVSNPSSSTHEGISPFWGPKFSNLLSMFLNPVPIIQSLPESCEGNGEKYSAALLLCSSLSAILPEPWFPPLLPRRKRGGPE